MLAAFIFCDISCQGNDEVGLFGAPCTSGLRGSGGASFPGVLRKRKWRGGGFLLSLRVVCVG